MDEIQFFQSLREKNQADKHTLYLLGKLYKEKKMYKEALAVLAEALVGAGELNEIIIKEITDISSLQQITGNSMDCVLCQSGDTEKCDHIENVNKNDMKELDDEEDQEDGKGGCHIIDISKAVWKNSPQITFKDVGGLAELKRNIDMKIIKPFQSPHLFEKFKKKSGGGILLYGPPGCGKTFIAKATAGECSAYFRSVGATDVLSPYLGESEQNLKNIFEIARKKRPCVLFFDELDTLGFNRSKAGSSSVRSVVDQMLVEIEGIESNTEKLLIMGATNMPWDVDEALKRPGRFDRSIFVHPPDCAAREEIFKLKLSGRPTESVDYSILAETSEFFSGADIENVIELAAERVLEDILTTGNPNLKITHRLLFEVLSGVKASTLGWLKTISTYVKYANQTGYYNDVEEYLAANKSKL